MKTSVVIILLLAAALSTPAAIFSSGAQPGAAIPDANLTGWSSSYTFAGIDPVIQNVSVSFQVSGGYNGDLYAYLTYGGVLVPLLNRVGVGTEPGDTAFGYSTSGMNVSLSGASGLVNIHDVQSPASGGTQAADGRAISPLSAAASFDAAPTTGLFAYNGLNPNGTWTLFFADVSGGNVSTVNGWSLSIEAVPEPVNVALGIFGGVLLLIGIWRKGRQVLRSMRRARAKA